jgi:hypothetical protein
MAPQEKHARQREQTRVGKMLHLPDKGYRVFRVQLYNEQVRTLSMRELKHRFFDRRWAEPQMRDVVARDEEEAWSLISERFPPEDGFVVEHITASVF